MGEGPEGGWLEDVDSGEAVDLVIVNGRWPRFGENRADIKKGTERRKEATVTIVTTARSEMRRMLREGVPIARIARRLGVSRQTIYTWKKQAEGGEATKEKRRSRSTLDPFRDYSAGRFRLSPGAAGVVGGSGRGDVGEGANVSRLGQCLKSRVPGLYHASYAAPRLLLPTPPFLFLFSLPSISRMRR